MIKLTSIFAAIKGASLTTKISLSIGAVAIIVGGAAGTVAIININKSQSEPQIVADDHNDDNSSSEQSNAQPEETEKPKEPENSAETKPEANQKPANTSSNSQSSTQKPNSNNSTSNNSPSSNNSSASQPSTSTTQPSQPSQSTQPAKKPDYNLNDHYVAGYVTLAFSKQDESGEWYVAEQKQFFGVAKFTGSTADLDLAVMPQYIAYAEAHGYPYGGGMDAMGLTWEDAVRNGTALDEAKCAQYGLSCGRW